MKKSAILTGVKMDEAMYFTRVVSFDFAANGIGMPFFRQIQKNV